MAAQGAKRMHGRPEKDVPVFFSTSYFLGVQTTEIRLNTGYTWEAIHRVSLLVTLFPLKLPTIWNRARLDGVT
jgi:hypothetical protein